MSEKSYGSSANLGIDETRDVGLERNLPALEGFRWLSAGWRDLWDRLRLPAWLMGLGLFLFRFAFIWILPRSDWDYICSRPCPVS